MRIARFVALLVMPPVAGHPEEQRPLDCHVAGDPDQLAHRGNAVKTPVREQPVNPQRDPRDSDEIHAGADHEIGPGNTVLPQQHDGRDQCDEGHDDRDESDDAFDADRGIVGFG